MAIGLSGFAGLLSVLLPCFLCVVGQTEYQIGTGIFDITGPAAEVNLMGYANPAQTANGIHMRQYSRAFVFADKAGENRFVFVSTDSCMLSQEIKLEVVKQLKALYPGLYTERNVGISGIHTHSGPGGFHQYLLYDITSWGFVKASADALVVGIVESIKQAHESVRPANVYLSVGELLDSNINRSPSAYLNNPKEERERYKYDVDKNMTVLRIEDGQGRPLGMINWFAVHCTSMNNTNGLISSDNKGYASQLFERYMIARGDLSIPGRYVAAFAQSNLGDVSPNTKGPHCIDSGLPCDILTSTCHGKNELCIASGPGKDMFDSTKIIGRNQFTKALELFSSTYPNMKLSGPVGFRHSYVDMTNVEVQLNTTTKVKTCKPAMGYSFAAGTTDGPGAFDFKQGSNSSNPFWNFVRDLIKSPTPEQISCHKPKPILLDTGEITKPYLWQPQIVDVQLFTVGQLAIILPPAEFTTMSGRRTRDAVTHTLISNGWYPDTVSVIAGLSNDYADYVTTYEEYQIQRYEGASTIYGPHTLQAYIQVFKTLAEAVAKNKTVVPGPNPPNLLSKQLSFLPPVLYDTAPLGKNFGDVKVDASPSYAPGSVVEVTFISANPRNDLRTNDTFLTVEQKEADGSWTVIFTDADWETRYYWKMTSLVFGESDAIIQWEIPEAQSFGTYRVQHFGSSKSITGTIKRFTGKSREFLVKKSKYIH
ncbi:neutral ceramidase B-like [Babylonia areolata]|uniref:neutral ceramidase B-like n=1 Tax=Babylonia areolata TaxID=304850 RepID=UPI003FD3CC80